MAGITWMPCIMAWILPCSHRGDGIASCMAHRRCIANAKPAALSMPPMHEALASREIEELLWIEDLDLSIDLPAPSYPLKVYFLCFCWSRWPLWNVSEAPFDISHVINLFAPGTLSARDDTILFNTRAKETMRHHPYWEAALHSRRHEFRVQSSALRFGPEEIDKRCLKRYS